MSINNIYGLTVGFFLIGLGSCASEAPDIVNEEEDGKNFYVTASLASESYTRAYQNEGNVLDGTYYMTYTDSDNEYNLASVNFNVEGMTPGIGVVTVPGNDNQLKWTGIGGGSTPTFYLDNVVPIENDETTASKVVFTDTENPYKAAPFDSINGSNDLLWGSKQVNRGVKNVNFDLHHNMSRVRVQLTVDRTNVQETEKLDVENAVVEITSINQIPVSYDRVTGSLQLDTININEAYTPLVIVDPNQSDRPWNRHFKVNSVDSPETVENEEVNSESQIIRYISGDFVLPPQALLEDSNRPQLKITMPDGDVFTGIIPHAMLIDNETTGSVSYPVALYFLKEHILTIRTIITEEPPSISFMPVWVTEWVDKGTFSIEAHQSGFYTSQEFYSMIEYYNVNNEYQLIRYGQLVTPDESDPEEVWAFDFFSGMTLEYGKIYNMMRPGTGGRKNFYFNNNNYGIFVSNSAAGETKPVNMNQLYRIVTGSLQWANL